MSDKQYTISACLMLKNSEDTLPIYLNYVRDNFDELCVLLDPESHDDSEKLILEFAKTFPTKIEYEVTENFSDRLDKVFSMATCEYFVHMDADEIFERKIIWHHMCNLMQKTKATIGFVEIIHLQKDLNHRLISPDKFKPRMFKTGAGVKNDTKIMHGTIDIRGHTLTRLPITLLHFGHIRSTEQLTKKGKDTLQFLGNNDADDVGLIEHGENWFWKRNEVWNTNIEPLPKYLQYTFKDYIPEDHYFWTL